MRETVVQFGAGAIGRGFLAQLWTQAGYEVVFVDANRALVDQLNAAMSYPLRLTDGNTVTTHKIAPVRALHVADADTVRAALETCAFASIAVGTSYLTLAPLFAEVKRQKTPLNILVCENEPGAPQRLGEAIPHTIGCIGTVVGRMVPSQTSETLMAEVYDQLPFDKTNWRGTIPSVPGLVAVENFEGVAAQKRYLHNGGHFLLAAHGILRGYEFIWQCAQDNEAVEALVGFWSDVGEALHRAYGFSWEELGNYQNDLLRRFRNKPLADTVARVFRSPLRKLQPNERLLGAAQLCLASGVTPTFTAAAIATVLRAAERTPAAIELPPSLVEIVKSAYNSSQYVYPAHRDI